MAKAKARTIGLYYCRLSIMVLLDLGSFCLLPRRSFGGIIACQYTKIISFVIRLTKAWINSDIPLARVIHRHNINEIKYVRSCH